MRFQLIIAFIDMFLLENGVRCERLGEQQQQKFGYVAPELMVASLRLVSK